MSPEYKCKRHSDGSRSFSLHEPHRIRRCLKENIHNQATTNVNQKSVSRRRLLLLQRPSKGRKTQKASTMKGVRNMIEGGVIEIIQYS